MSTHKHIDRICCVAVIIALLITAVFMNYETFGITASDKVLGYENKLFDTSKVHTVDIVMNDWDSFIDTCQNEEYSMCSVVIDGEAFKNVGIRAKGNTSLSSVASMNSERYSFKIEFDQYDSTKSYHGLDKLCLNNIIQDNTYMKDYLVYQMMNDFGVNSPLCSYVYITVNGEDWGLYLAVEGIEDGFLQRNYGTNHGKLYKPDSMSFGGGRGNGKDFNMNDFDFGDFDFSDFDFDNFDPSSMNTGEAPQMPGNFDQDSANNGEAPQMPDNFDQDSTNTGEAPQMPDNFDQNSTNNGEIPQMPGNFENNSEETNSAEETTDTDTSDNTGFLDKIKEKMGDFADKMDGFGMGSDDVKLQYIDDDPSSYSNIFDNAKTDITEEDQERLIASLKSLSNYEDLENVINIEEVIRYFVVHNFVVNGDSYTGSMIHNYYLYEKDGQLSMIPWDYNLAFGTFQGNNADSSVNDSIDYSDGSMSDRPMLNWIFENEEYTELYYQYFDEFISEYFENGYVAELIDSTVELISPYVEKDPTKFCTYEEFEKGSQTLKDFCQLRAESVRLQIDGNDDTVDASSITLSDMGTMNNGGGGGGMQMPDNMQAPSDMQMSDNAQAPGDMQMPSNAQAPSDMQMPDNAQAPSDMQMPDNAQAPGNMQMPDNAQTFDGNNDFSNSFGRNFGGSMSEKTQNSSDTENTTDAEDTTNSKVSTDTDSSADTKASADTETSVDTESSADTESFADTESSADTETAANTKVSTDIKDKDNSRQFDKPDMPGFSNTEQSHGIDQNTFILLGICGITLLFGLLFAWRYKR